MLVSRLVGLHVQYVNTNAVSMTMEEDDRGFTRTEVDTRTIDSYCPDPWGQLSEMFGDNPEWVENERVISPIVSLRVVPTRGFSSDYTDEIYSGNSLLDSKVAS